jgi:hypothetical protein
MNELEHRIRRALRDPRRELPAWPDPMRRIRRSARRQRARVAGLGTALAGATAAVVVIVAQVAASPGRPARPTAPACPAVTAKAAPPGGSPAGIRMRLARPGALAVGPQGQLYIADDGLDQILQALPGGGFRVVAGNGRRGYSGDGGPAVRASLNDPGGLAVTPAGTIYVADTGNNRVRAVSAAGIILTVAGDGRYANWAAGGTPARATSLGGPAAVAVGPGGCLYIADEGASEILRLDAAGRVIRVAGVRGAAGETGVATRASADGPNGLAFDAAGDLFAAGSGTKSLLMITDRGRMRLPAGPGNFYPRGPGGMVPLPAGLVAASHGLVAVPGRRATGQGGVLAMNGQRVQQVSPRGLRTLFDFSREHPAGIRGFLPNGIAVSARGAIYLDTAAGNGYAAKTALIEVRPSGGIRVIWQE